MPCLIESIKIDGLYGLYDYHLPNDGGLTNAVILYGDNGVGKSTILRIVFHMLSCANNRGHRTALFNSDFDNLEVHLSSGITLVARRNRDSSPKILYLSIVKKKSILAEWHYRPDEDKINRIEELGYIYEFGDDGNPVIIHKKSRAIKMGALNAPPQGNKAYLSVLEKTTPKIFILNAERKLDSDSVADPSDEMELRRLMHVEMPKRINELAAKSREIGLSQALDAAANWLRRKAIIGANQGSTNVHTVYVDVLKHLTASKDYAASSADSSNNDDSFSELSKKLLSIEESMKQHARYELSNEISTIDFRKSLNRGSGNNKALASNLLQPYVRSLESRLEALNPLYSLIDIFITTINDFLTDKKIEYKLSHGFSIINKIGQKLEPSQLSSGEQQLLLLFSYVLISRDEPSVFMIDEPEISLNIKWQRKLVKSLLGITENANIQFIFASHSMELLSLHKDRVVKMDNRRHV